MPRAATNHRSRESKSKSKSRGARRPPARGGGGAKAPKKRPGGKPKRARSAYIFFTMDQRPKLVEEQPGQPFGHYSKVLGERWQSMSDEEKAPYAEKAEQDKARHREELDAAKSS